MKSWIKEVFGKIRETLGFVSPKAWTTVAFSLIVGILVTLKVAGVIHIGWVWFYGLPLTAFSALLFFVVFWVLELVFRIIINTYKNGRR